MKKIVYSIILLFVSVSLCCGEELNTRLPEYIRKELGKKYISYRIANKNDFGRYFIPMKTYRGVDIKKYFNTLIIADLNGDSRNDYTLLLISKKEQKFCFVSFISSGNKFEGFILSTSNWPKEHDGSIWQLMWLKPAGDYGLSKEKYFNAPGKEYPFLSEHSENDVKEYRDAVEKYRGMIVIEKTDSQYGAFEVEDLFYFKKSFYFQNGEMKSVQKCD